MNEQLLATLACAACRGRLTPDAEGDTSGLVCVECGRRFAVSLGRPVVLPDDVDAAGWAEWEEKQAKGLESYEAPDPETKRFFDGVAREFAAFCEMSGVVLDVGCGIEPDPQYAPTGDGVTYIGVDPLLASEPPPFPFVQGVAEALPFADASFDWALSATSFDHFPEPERALAEIRRVLRPDGRFGAWLGVVDPTYLARVDAARFSLPAFGRSTATEVGRLLRERQVGTVVRTAWRHGVTNRVAALRAAYARRRHADDRLAQEFSERMEQHFRFYREEEFVDLLARGGFEIERSCRVGDLAHGDSLFVVARPGTP